MTTASTGPFDLGEERTVWSVGGVAPMEVVSVPVKIKDKKLMHWQYVKLNNGTPGAVAIAVHKGKIALVTEWRLPIRAYSLEVPRGRGIPGETLAQTAERELLEETGLEASAVAELGSIYPDSGTLSAPIGVAVMSVKTSTGNGVSDGEVESWAWYSESELDEMMVNGNFNDSISR